MALSPAPRNWSSALPDLLAFAVGLAVVWVRGWSTTDLIWPLWLSSLVVGYALIVWAVAQPALETARSRLAASRRGGSIAGMERSDAADAVHARRDHRVQCTPRGAA